KPEAGGAPTDPLYAIGQLNWLVDIDSIRLEGELRDAAGSSYAINLSSGAIRPGEETSIEASLKLSSREALHAGLKDFDSNTRVILKQNAGGGFEQLRIESLTNASDAGGRKLLTASQEFDLTVQGFEERASLRLEFNADLPRPEIFLPEMSGLGPLNVQGSIAAEAEGAALTLTKSDLLLSAKETEVLSVKLNKQFTLGGTQDLSGNLMDMRITNLPLAWLGPWLPQGLKLSGEDLTAQFNLTGLPGGALKLSSTAPLRLGPLSASRDGAPLLKQVTIITQPVIRYEADQSIAWEMNNFKVQDQYGDILTGQSNGRFDASATSDGFFPAGLRTQTKLDLGLQEVTQQPALAGAASILSGRASIDLTLDPADQHPFKMQGKIDALSPRGYPGQKQDYRFALQLNEPKASVLALGANLQAGSENRPSSDLQFAGQVRPEASPLEFDADLTAQRLSQQDIEFLRAAFQAPQPADRAETIAPPTPSSPKPAQGTTRPQDTAAAPAAPPWAGYDGEVKIDIAELILLSGEVISNLKAEAVITEALLSLNKLEGSFKEGKLFGSGEARYSQRQRMAYNIQTDLRFENVDPAVFSKEPSGKFPVQGLFDGQASFSGQGATLDQALDAIEGELTVNGREGVLTAFELDTRSNLGLIGAGLLGQQLNRPGLTALAQAVPYFENMPFSNFTLKLRRGADKHVQIPELRFTGRNLLIDGSGSIAATSLKEVMSRPLDLTLELGAKGQLVDYLETLQLLGSETADDGFRRWKRDLQIKGTLSDPDTSALERILKEAANRALRKPAEATEQPAAEDEAAGDAAAQEGESPTQQNLQAEPSKEEKIIRDVERGLNLLFGQ
ncbi:MAG TPA: AsmA-like C-terminal region-containing protein, partial [Opitutales bacterium]|nr:AsmA-like C-terminal region-containing protein [Opitutales bacterium]